MKQAATWIFSVLVLGLLSACEPDEPPEPMEPEPAYRVETGTDPHSFAEFEKVHITHMQLELDADMHERTLTGHVLLELERPQSGHPRLVLDTRDLDIQDVNAVDPDGDYLPVSWRLGEDHGHLGQPLIIVLPQGIEQVRIDYATSPEAFGLQWLNAEQTSSGKPFMFSQSQPHYARTWVPLQDTPAVRYTFDATIRGPRDLMVVMGADGNRFERNDVGEYDFHMPEPIPSYLMAIAIGDLEFAETGPRTGVYAEPQWIEAAAEEFDVLEEMVNTGEELYGSYRWGRYDLLVLPPSFPFGGMENPRLSFITPTIIAGDKSLVALIAHELAHSWSGNLVSNATWRDLWLNEGFTTYVTNRIMEAVFGEERAQMEAYLNYRSLREDMAELPPEDEILAIDLRGRDPDAVFSNVPYVKGQLFLTYLEEQFGRERFDRFLRGYFDHFEFRSITTDEFLAYLEKHLIEAHPGKVDMDKVRQWVFEPGLPADAVLPPTDVFDSVKAARKAWMAGEKRAAELETGDWTVHEWLYFLNELPEELSGERLARLDEAFGLTASENAEIAHAWLLIAIRNDYRPAWERLESYLTGIGRRKLIEPLYKQLAGTEAHRQFACRVYEKARPGYHPLAQGTMDEILDWGDNGCKPPSEAE